MSTFICIGRVLESTKGSATINFKGVVSGAEIDKVIVDPLKEKLKVGEIYMLYISDASIEGSTIKGKVHRARHLKEDEVQS